MLKKLLIAGLALLALTGCGSAAAADKSQGNPAGSSHLDSQPVLSPEEDYLQRMHVNHAFDGYTDEMLTTFGNATCTQLRDAMAVETTLYQLSTATGSLTMAGSLVGAVSVTLCPDTKPKVDAFQAQGGFAG